jgi:hypothetical protein
MSQLLISHRCIILALRMISEKTYKEDMTSLHSGE